MLNQQGRSQYPSPLWLQSLDQDAAGMSLHRLPLSKTNGTTVPQFDESWLQRLLYRHPETLPIIELEPGIGELVPVGLELPTPAGYVDNVFVTRTGNIVLAECKLWRNPEARRLVIAQIIDYAQGISRWGYQAFDEAVRKCQDAQGKPLNRPLIELVNQTPGDIEGLDEPTFVDAIQRNLRLGRLLLLVAGDGIREDTQGLADFLQMHAGFHFTLGLVEIAVFKGPNDGFIVQPRILARTLNIERAVVRLASDAIIAEQSDSSKPESKGTLSEELFFEQLRKNAPETASLLKAFVAEAAGLGVFLAPAKKSVSVRCESPNGTMLTLGGVDLSGNFISYNVNWTPHSLGKADLGHNYLQALSRIVGGSVRTTPHPGQWYVVKSGTTPPPAIDLLREKDQWLDAISEYQAQFSEAGEA